MKKIYILLCLFLSLLTGCSKKTKNDVIKEIDSKISYSYSLEGNLSVLSNENIFNYKVYVDVLKNKKYKVSLTNISNNHTQVILKNYDGVYVVTPELNKCFKFQSNWPNNSSQIFLIDSILHDLCSEKSKFTTLKDGFSISSPVNYSNNRLMKKQKVYIDKNFNIKNIKVVDKNNSIQMEFNIKKVKYSPKLPDKIFQLDFIMHNYRDCLTKPTTKLDESIYPLFLPNGIRLTSNEKLKKHDGERIIMSFDGDKSFLLVEETANVFDEFTIIPSYGEPYFLSDTLGVMTDNSLSWISNGIEYYMISDEINTSELAEIARSISVIPTMK